MRHHLARWTAVIVLATGLLSLVGCSDATTEAPTDASPTGSRSVPPSPTGSVSAPPATVTPLDGTWTTTLTTAGVTAALRRDGYTSSTMPLLAESPLGEWTLTLDAGSYSLKSTGEEYDHGTYAFEDGVLTLDQGESPGLIHHRVTVSGPTMRLRVLDDSTPDLADGTPDAAWQTMHLGSSAWTRSA